MCPIQFQYPLVFLDLPNDETGKNIKLSLELIKHHVKMCEVVKVQLHSLLTSALGGECSASRPGRFTPEERPPGTHWTGGSMGPRAGLDAEAKIIRKIFCPFRESNPGRPARSQ
jgi:hypothetical protein